MRAVLGALPVQARPGCPAVIFRIIGSSAVGSLAVLVFVKIGVFDVQILNGLGRLLLRHSLGGFVSWCLSVLMVNCKVLATEAIKYQVIESLIGAVGEIAAARSPAVLIFDDLVSRQRANELGNHSFLFLALGFVSWKDTDRAS